MFSPLARGYGTWTGGINLKTENEVTNLEDIREEGSETHRHGVTVSPRVFRSNTNYSLSSRKDDGQVNLPKTYVTKKGALLLFTAPPGETAEKTKQTAKLLHRKKVENLLDCSLKLNTLERLYLSALQYGDLSGYEKDKRSITDPENQLFLKFLHGIDGHDIDSSTQPGGELDIYLRDLKTRASGRLFGSADSSSRKQRSDELRDLLQELDGVWRSKTQSSLKKESSSLSQRKSGKGTRILSSKSLTASLKSSTYLGRSDSPATNISSGADNVSPVILPDITSRTSRKSRRQSWVAPVTPTEQNQPPEKSTTRTITRVPTGKKQREFSAKSASEGRRSVQSRSSQLSSSTVELDEKRSSSSRSSDIKEEHNEIAAEDYIKEHETEGKDDAIIPEAASYQDITSDSQLISDVQSHVPEEVITMKDDQEGDMLVVNINELEGNNLNANQDILVGSIVHALEDALIDDDSKPALLEERIITEDLEEKTSVASSVLEEQDILLPSDGEETVLEFSEQPEEWPTTVPQLEVTVRIIDDDQHTEGETGKEGEKERTDNKLETYLTEQHVPRPPSEVQSSQNRRSRLSGRLSAMSQGSTESGKLGKADINTSEIKNVTGGDVINIPTDKLQTEEDEEKDDMSYLGMNQDGTESEKSMSFVFVHDNSTSDSASVGRRNLEEDLVELERRRRRNKLLYGFRNSIYDDDEEEEDNFEAKAKEAKEKEMEFIRIIEVDSDTDVPKEEETKDVQEKEKSKKDAKKQGEKVYVKALEITSIAPPVEEIQEPEESLEDEEVEDEEEDKPWVHPNQQFFPDGPLPKFVVPDEEAALPTHLEEMLNRRSASKSAEELENELRQMQDILNNEMAGPSMTIDDGEVGLTEQELKLAQEVLQDRVKEVSSKIFNTGDSEPEQEEQPEKKAVKTKKKSGRGKKGGKSKKKVKKEVEPQPVDRKRSVAEERDTIRQQRKLEKQQRLEEMKELQEKIHARQEERKRQEDDARKKAEELANEQELLMEQAAAIQRDEEEAREQLAAIRHAQRQERDARRKAEQERRRQLAIARRQMEKEMRDRAREKELEMLRRLGDAEDVRQLIEEEEKKQEEEDRISQENFEEEMREQQALLEEEEMRARELEREAEEEALQRLVLEREAAERRRRELREEEEKLRKEEELLRQNMLLEEERLREEQRLKELKEQEKIEQEKSRLEELKKLEEEARSNMRVELEYKKEWALKRREVNLERRSHLDKLGYGQGLTRAWVFSYFPLCPSVSYNRSVDRDPLSKKGIQIRLKPSATKEGEQPIVDPPVEESLPGLTPIAEE